jgi:uncharacterized protein DUF222
VLTAIQALVDADLQASGGTDLRTSTQRWADALCELAHRFLHSPERPTVASERPHVRLTVDFETLRGAETGGTNSQSHRCELDHVGAIHAAAARRLACDASVLPVVMGGPSEALDLGRRTPVVSAGLRRAVVLRDRRCRFPTCTRPHAWCDVHHVVHWGRRRRDRPCQSGVAVPASSSPGARRGISPGDGGKPLFARPDGSVIEEVRAPP